MGLTSSLIIIGIGFAILALIVFWAIKSLNSSTIPRGSNQKPISRMTRKELKRMA